jgi:hypothetical protein
VRAIEERYASQGAEGIEEYIRWLKGESDGRFSKTASPDFRG